VKKSQLTLIFVVSLFTPYGGMQRTLLRIANECVQRGHRVNILTGEWQGERPDNIGIIEVNTRALSNHQSNDKLARKLSAFKKDNNYDVVIGFTKIPGLDVYYAGDPCYAARMQERGSLTKWLPRYRAFRRQEEAVFRVGSHTQIILIAHQEKAQFQHYYQTESHRFHLLPPGINRERLQQNPPDAKKIQHLRASFGVAEKDTLLLGVGSRFRTKGVDRLIQALATTPSSSKLVFVGEGETGPYLRLAKELGVENRVSFTGSRDDVADFYYVADMLLHAPRTENTGTVLIEAMICGLPVLVTANCGFAFHVKNANAGVVCEDPFEQTAFNTCLQKMLSSIEDHQWQKNGPDYCAKTDVSSLITRAADVIENRE
jgi:UDP-glucose:(heptosyl)LPS alpha-1,3-glucosyltransferase